MANFDSQSILMRKMRIFWPAFTTFVSMVLPSCEKEVSYEFNQTEKLVVFSNFTQNNALDVLVYKTKALDSGDPTGVDFISDATVMVFGQDNFQEVLELIPGNAETGKPPFYRSRGLVPQTGELYIVKVSAPGFEPVTAENSIPVPVPIESVQYNSNFAEPEDDDTEQVLGFDVSVTVQDPPDQKNYYHLIFYQELFSYMVTPDGDTLRGIKLYAEPKTLYTKDPNLPVLKNFDQRGFLADDRHFNGKKMVFDVAGSYSFDNQKFLPGNFLIELRSVSEAYFFHYSTLTMQGGLGGNPLSEGVVIYDNIENGVGIFAGYSSSVNTVKITD
jgi:hypothetical protein